MLHPNYGKNRNSLLDVDREIEKILNDQTSNYFQNIEKHHQ